MPIASIGGALSGVLFNPKYAGCVSKVTIAVTNLENIIFLSPLAPGDGADVLIWDHEGPQASAGHLFLY